MDRETDKPQERRRVGRDKMKMNHLLNRLPSDCWYSALVYENKTDPKILCSRPCFVLLSRRNENSSRMIGIGQSKLVKDSIKMQAPTQSQLQSQSHHSQQNNGSGSCSSSVVFSPASHVLVAAQAQHPSVEKFVGPPSPISYSPPLTVLNPKAEALAEAHRSRVEAEAHDYLESQIRKLEARGQRLQAKAERQRMREEAKAFEAKKREEVRAKLLLQNSQSKVDRIISKAHEDAYRIKAHAKEQIEKTIVEADTRAEQWKAEIEEKKRKEVAEITNKVHLMIAVGELASSQEHNTVVQKMKNHWACHP